MNRPATTPADAARDAAALTYEIGFRTDVGQQRSLNEDAAATFDLPGTATEAFVVCDGMGGLAAGDAASNEAVRVVRASLEAHFAAGPPADIEAALRDAFTRANDAVNALHATGGAGGEDDPTVRPGTPASSAALMGTTCVAGFVIGSDLWVAHAGDSRAYLWRGGKLIPLTEDHSYVAERVKAGDITEAEARVSKFRNMITRAIGIEPTVNPEVRREPLAPGDTVLVCSDGLTTMIEDAEIASLMRAPAVARAPAPDKAAAALVEAANKKGGHDNITVLLLRVRGANGAAPESDSVRPGGGVVDLDAPGRRGGGNQGAIIVVLCALLALAALAAGVLLTRLRQEQNKPAASPAPVTPGGVASSPLTVDYSRLVYDAPQLFTTTSARPDILAWSREGGLYIVGGASGKLVSLDADGRPGTRSVAEYPVLDVTAAPVPETRLYVAADPQGNVYTSFTRRRVIEKRSPDGRLLATIKGFFERPEALTVDEEGNLYVIDGPLVKILRAHAPNATPVPKAAGGAAGKKASPAPKGAAAKASPAGKAK